MRGRRTRRLIDTIIRAHAYRDWRHIADWIRSIQPPGRTALTEHLPWLPYRVIDLLEAKVRAEMVVFEFGSGGSTIWFASRGCRVVSVEHDLEWSARVRSEARAAAVEQRVTLLEVASEAGPAPAVPGSGVRYDSELAPGNYQRYAQAIDRSTVSAFDVIVVDGRSRAACLLHAVPRLRPGGILVLDDSDRERYAEAIARVPDWERREFVGLRPTTETPGRATVWIRPPAPA